MRERPPCSPIRTSSRNGSPVDFFGQRLAERLLDDGYAADLIVGNNGLAHVPDAHDFVEEPCQLLKAEGIVTDCQLVVPIPEVAVVG
jgi:2-polyprenyl-3-methyl-5-hydroxy-6-metoxy-1,4-benzoquinol methylase